MNAPTTGPDARDRRKHVRVRPASDFEVRVELHRQGGLVHLPVVDLSLGGFGLLLTSTLAICAVGEVLALQVTTPLGPTFAVSAAVRHLSESKGVCGVEFNALTPEANQILRRVVSELMARGQLA